MLYSKKKNEEEIKGEIIFKFSIFFSLFDIFDSMGFVSSQLGIKLMACFYLFSI